MGRRLTQKERSDRRELKRLIGKIRKTKKYLRWKLRILSRDVKSYPKIPKNVQVHHRIEISKLLLKYQIKTVKDAIKCSELWQDHLGITLKRGEHFIFTKIGRYKYLTEGFRNLLLGWLDNTKYDPLDANKKRRSGKGRK